MIRIRDMSHYVCKVNVQRFNEVKTVLSTELVPGDLVILEENKNLPCDMILLRGQCIVNESMLTGESVPIIKASLPNSQEIYNPETDQKYTLYSGTKVLQIKQEKEGERGLGLVIRTGFTTSKGNMVRDILYPSY